MGDSVAYKNSSIINIGSDNYTVNSGSVTRNGNTLTLSKNSRCTFSYSYSNDKPLSSTHLKMVYDITASNDNNGTRYSNNIQIYVNIQYYESESSGSGQTYRDGKKQTIQIIPYKNNEKTGAYKYEEINLNSNYIKSIDVIIAYYNSSQEQSSVTINKLNLFSTVIGSESSINESLDYNELDDYLNDYMDEYMDEHYTDKLLIPYEPSVPAAGTRPAGYICRLF